jgi:hypothetical protein
VRRVSGASVDPETGAVTPDSAIVYQGRCKVQHNRVQASTPEAGLHSWTMQNAELHIPVTAAPVWVGDEVLIDSAAYDPVHAGLVFRVTDSLRKTWATAQRLSVEEVAG